MSGSLCYLKAAILHTAAMLAHGIAGLSNPMGSVRHMNHLKKKPSGRLLPIRKHREERENGIASAVPFSHFSVDAVTFDISKAPMPL